MANPNDDMMTCKLPRDVVERARDIAPVLGKSIGQLLGDIARPELAGLEKQALSRFQAKLGSKK
jgi:hypothetical protein